MVHEPPEEKKLTPAVIANAPDSVPAHANDVPEIPPGHPIWILFGELQVEIADLHADNDRLKAETDPVIVKARLLKPFANRVFGFLVAYTAAVFVILFFCGFKVGGFHLPDGVVTVLAGTSFVAVAGLIGTIISGLLSSK